MFLKRYRKKGIKLSLLHACGDVSSCWQLFRTVIRSAPRMWRCFFGMLCRIPFAPVCSTHVEMFLCLSRLLKGACGLLHACGDVSIWLQWTSRRTMSAPRMWRCFLAGFRETGSGQVCSTHVEMFPLLPFLSGQQCSVSVALVSSF